MSYISEVQAKKMICDAARGIRLCVATTVNGVNLTSNDTFYDLLVAIDGLSGGTGTFNTLSGDVTSTSTGGNTTIGANKVTNAKAAQMPTLTVKGNNTGSTTNQADLTVAQVRTMLDSIQFIAPTTYTDITAQTTATANGTATQNSTTKDVVLKNFAGNTYTILGSTGSGSSLMRVRQNGADIKYTVVSGNPTVTFTKSGGTGTVGYTGGVIDVQRVQVDFNTTSDTDGANDFAVVVPTTQSGTMLQYPNVLAVNTQNGSTPATVAHLYKNPASTPVFSVIAGTAGTSITVKIAGTNVLGSTGTIILNF